MLFLCHLINKSLRLTQSLTTSLEARTYSVSHKHADDACRTPLPNTILTADELRIHYNGLRLRSLDSVDYLSSCIMHLIMAQNFTAPTDAVLR